MFYEKGNASNTFVWLQEHTQGGNTKENLTLFVYKKTPQSTFKTKSYSQ